MTASFDDTDIAHVILAFRLRSWPTFKRRYVIYWWVDQVHRSKSDEAKRALADTLDSTFNEWSNEWFDLEKRMGEATA